MELADLAPFAPELAVYYYNRGLLYASKGDLDKAIADYTEAIRLLPEFTVAYYEACYRRGKALAAIGEHAKAQADFAKVGKVEYEPE